MNHCLLIVIAVPSFPIAIHLKRLPKGCMDQANFHWENSLKRLHSTLHNKPTLIITSPHCKRSWRCHHFCSRYQSYCNWCQYACRWHNELSTSVSTQNVIRSAFVTWKLYTALPFSHLITVNSSCELHIWQIYCTRFAFWMRNTHRSYSSFRLISFRVCLMLVCGKFSVFVCLQVSLCSNSN